MLDSATPRTVAHQASLSMEFSRQEHWSGLPFPSPEDLPSPGIEPRSPSLQADSLLSGPPGKPYIYICKIHIIYIHIWIYVHAYINVHACVCICAYVCVNVCVLCVFVFMHVCV